MEELNPFLTRVNAIVTHYGWNQNQFCKRVGVCQTTMSSMYLRNAEPNFKTCKSILDALPDISAEWLMRGNGEMLLSERDRIANSNINHGNVNGNLTQVVASEDLQKEMAKIKMMLRGCLSNEDYNLVVEEINKASHL